VPGCAGVDAGGIDSAGEAEQGGVVRERVLRCCHALHRRAARAAKVAALCPVLSPGESQVTHLEGR